MDPGVCKKVRLRILRLTLSEMPTPLPSFVRGQMFAGTARGAGGGGGAAVAGFPQSSISVQLRPGVVFPAGVAPSLRSGREGVPLLGLFSGRLRGLFHPNGSSPLRRWVFIASGS
jgi:hypothetical protein